MDTGLAFWVIPAATPDKAMNGADVRCWLTTFMRAFFSGIIDTEDGPASGAMGRSQARLLMICHSIHSERTTRGLGSVGHHALGSIAGGHHRWLARAPKARRAMPLPGRTSLRPLKAPGHQ